MPKATLSAAFAANATCRQGKRRTDYWCDQISGFVLSVRESGGATWSLRYLQNGRQRDHKIGRYGEISFDQARKAARRIRAEVVLGGDPMAERQEKRAVITYAALSVMHLEFSKPRIRSFESLEMIIRRHLLPRWGRLRLDEITPQVIAKWLGEKSEEGLAPATVEKIRVVFGRSFELARQWSIPGADKNPVRGVRGPKFDNARQRFLSIEESNRLLHAAGQSQNVQLRPLIALLLLTGARLGELVKAQWKDVDLERRSWLIPVAKTKPRYLPLARAAVEILENLPRFENCPWVIPNPETRRPFVSVKHAWQKTRRDARLCDVRLHDLRHTHASQLANSGISLLTISILMGHRDLASTKRYSHMTDASLLSAVEAGASKLSEQWG